MTTVAAPALLNAVVYLLTEAYAGPPNPAETWFIDNEPNCGILGVIAGLSAAEASTSADGSGQAGSTIAANVEHLRWSLAQFNAAIRGQSLEERWEESWKLLTVDTAAWERLRTALRVEFETLCAAFKQQEHLPEEYLTGTLAVLPHAALHLGTIRQMSARIRQGGQPV
jgi:hypothetical protein